MTVFPLPQNVEFVFKRLVLHGFEAFVVGGAVRDFLLGKMPNDFDIATNATPEKIKSIFFDCKCFFVGEKFGTITIVFDDGNVEVTTFRRDGDYIDHRHPTQVEFSNNLIDDLSRRDFTINAMAYGLKTGIVDFFGGQGDLKNKIVKTVGEPKKRFFEDGLRILRAIRFASVLDFQVESKTEQAIFEKKSLLKSISAERIFAEFSKMLLGNGIGHILIDYIDVLGVFLPEILPMKNFDQHSKHHCHDVLTHTAIAVQSAPCDLTLRLAMLFHDSGKPATFSIDENGNGHFYGHAKVSKQIAISALKRLKASKNLIQNVAKLVEFHDIEIIDDKKHIKRLLSKFGEKFVFDLIAVQIADNAGQLPLHAERPAQFEHAKQIVKQIVAENDCFSLKKMAINGNDVKSFGYVGKQIGDVLQKCLNAIVCGNLTNKREKLLDYIKNMEKK